MRRIFSSILAVLYATLFIVSPLVSAQATSGDDAPPAFELVMPATATANEAFSVTVKALKPDGSIDTSYVGSISFAVTPNTTGATIPYDLDKEPVIDPNDPTKDPGYTFPIDEHGQHAFPSFTFPQAGTYEITVLDNATYSEVTKSITITGGGSGTTGTATVTIIEPVAQTTVNASTLIVAGTSKPTSTINFYLGSDKKSSTTSDTEGGFSGTISGLVEGANTIKVEVLDGAGKSLGTSTVTVNYSLDAPKINSLTLKEGTEVFAGSTVHIEAVGDPGLKTVVVKFGDKNVVLTEDTTRLGIYTGTTQLGSFEGEIKPTVNVESYQGTTADFTNLLNINVVSSSFQNVKVEGTPDKKARFTFSLKTELDEIKYFKIKYGTRSGVYDQDVVTYEKTQIKKEDGQYTWYVPGLDPGEYYSTIVGLDKDKNELAINSGEQLFSLPPLDAAGTCYIDKVSGVTVKKSGSKSIITWDKLEDATSYQIFKKDTDGEYAMIDEITGTSYTVNIDMSSKEDVFEDFQIRATCKNGEIIGEGDYSESVSVQTGPAMIAFMMLLIASGVAFILMKRGYLR